MDLTLSQRYLDFRAEVRAFVARHKAEAPPAITIRDRGKPPPDVLDWQKQLIANGCQVVAEGANMPSTPEAIEAFQAAKVLFAPGKASNAGGVATSGLEMSQNSLRMNWTREEVDERLLNIMKDIHTQCVTYGTDASGYVDYVKGANIAGFVKVADAMIDHGVV